MSYINLLPPEDRKQGMNLRRWLILIGVVLYLSTLIGIYVVNHQQVAKLRQDFASYEDQIKMIDPTLERIQEMELYRQQMQARLNEGQALIQEVEFSQVLFWISQNLPQEITFSRLAFREKRFSLEGESPDYARIAQLIASLKDSDYFTDVELISSYTNPAPANSIGFNIRASIKVGENHVR